MKRRNFAQTAAAVLLVTNLPVTASVVKTPNVIRLQKFQKLKASNGLILEAKEHLHATKKIDDKQFIVNFKVKSSHADLPEGSYEFLSDKGKKVNLYLSPVNSKEMQAVFNLRTYA